MEPPLAIKDGAVAQGSKDAVNGGQLWNVQQQVDQNTMDISNIEIISTIRNVGLVQQAGKDATIGAKIRWYKCECMR
jgi:hypothetical protein